MTTPAAVLGAIPDHLIQRRTNAGAQLKNVKALEAWLVAAGHRCSLYELEAERARRSR